MMALLNGSVQLTNLSHLGIAVRGAEKTTRFLSSIRNVGTPEVFDYEPKQGAMISGGPFKVRLVTKMQEQKHPMLVAASFQRCRWYFDTSPGGMVVEIREEYKKKA
jgi:hypothetical protein